MKQAQLKSAYVKADDWALKVNGSMEGGTVVHAFVYPDLRLADQFAPLFFDNMWVRLCFDGNKSQKTSTPLSDVVTRATKGYASANRGSNKYTTQLRFGDDGEKFPLVNPPLRKGMIWHEGKNKTLFRYYNPEEFRDLAPEDRVMPVDWNLNIPSVALKNHFHQNQARWYRELWANVRNKTETSANVDFSSSVWATAVVRGFAETVGPDVGSIERYFLKLMLLKSSHARLGKKLRGDLKEAILAQLDVWESAWGDVARELDTPALTGLTECPPLSDSDEDHFARLLEVAFTEDRIFVARFVLSTLTAEKQKQTKPSRRGPGRPRQSGQRRRRSVEQMEEDDQTEEEDEEESKVDSDEEEEHEFEETEDRDTSKFDFLEYSWKDVQHYALKFLSSSDCRQFPQGGSKKRQAAEFLASISPPLQFFHLRDYMEVYGGDREVSVVLEKRCQVFGKYEGQGEGNFEVGSLSVRSHPPDVEKFDLPLVRHGHAQCHDLALGKWPSYWLGDEVFLDFDGNELRTLEAAYKYSQDTGNDVFVWHEVLKVIRDRSQRPKRIRPSVVLSFSKDPKDTAIEKIVDRLEKEGVKNYHKRYEMAEREYINNHEGSSRKRRSRR